jgi:hypothetical protein
MSDEKQEQPRMFTHRAFDRHPAVSRARAGYFKAVIMNALLITATIWGVLAIYWGALWRPYYGVHNLCAPTKEPPFADADAHAQERVDRGL